MPLLPVRVLPLKDAQVGPFLIRVDMDESSAAIYVRRQSGKQTWVCTVRSLQEILASPTQQPRKLDLAAVVTCLYHGLAHDASGLHAGTTELFRREVDFTLPDNAPGNNAQLTARFVVRTTTPTPAADAEAEALETVEDEVAFGFDFTRVDANIERIPADFSAVERHAVTLRLVGAGFPLKFLNWLPGPDRDLVYPVRDGVYLCRDSHMEVTLRIAHTTGPALFVLSMGATALKPDNVMTHKPSPSHNVVHTIAQYSFVAKAKSMLQIVLLHGSVCALDGTTLSIREEGHAPKKTQL